MMVQRGSDSLESAVLAGSKKTQLIDDYIQLWWLLSFLNRE
jgi:hypothetical protein